MRDRINNLFSGRQGMDEFSKALFWCGLACLLLSFLTGDFLGGFPGFLLRWLAFCQLILCFVRAFSRRLGQREMENNMFLSWLASKKRGFEAFKDRCSQRKDFRFYRCPGCKTMLRVPRGKGKIHIKCKCGYTLYRKT